MLGVEYFIFYISAMSFLTKITFFFLVFTFQHQEISAFHILSICSEFFNKIFFNIYIYFHINISMFHGNKQSRQHGVDSCY